MKVAAQGSTPGCEEPPMILTSPSKDLDQTPPVTTTFDPPEGSGVARLPRDAWGGRIDWGRVERLYSFVRARSSERLRAAERRHDLPALLTERKSVHAVDSMFTQARRGEGVVAACAITFLRARAMRDAQHPEFRGEWLGTATVGAQAA
jgi:hypothetical protein